MRFALAALALASALSVAGCAYLLDDPYGSYLQSSVAWTDLRSELGPGFSIDTIEGMTIARAGTKEYLFARMEDGSGGSVVRGLDPASLELADFALVPAGPAFAAAVDANAEFIVGTKAYFPSTMSADTLCSPSEGWIIGDTAAGKNYVIPFALPPATTLAFSSFDASWANETPLMKAFRAGSKLWRVARASRLDDGSIAVICFSGEGGKGSIAAALYPSVSAFASLPAARSSAEIDVDSGQGGIGTQAGLAAWATADGIVAVASDSGGTIRFVRYDYDGGSEKDDYFVSARHDARFYFETSGHYWYLYERASGRLYRLRTWWKR